jgi:hypothetical protein
MEDSFVASVPDPKRIQIRILKGLSSEIERGSKVVLIDRSPFKLPMLLS